MTFVLVKTGDVNKFGSLSSKNSKPVSYKEDDCFDLVIFATLLSNEDVFIRS